MPNNLTGVTWTCVASASSTCGSASGSGNISEAVNLLNGGSATYTVHATVSPNASGSLVNTATVTVPPGISDLISSNNTATDTDVIVPPRPVLAVLDSFNRTTGLGTNWQQALSAVGISANEATCTGGTCLLGAGTAYWNVSTFGAKQAASVLITNNPPTVGATPVNGASLVLKAGSTTIPANFIRVRYNAGNVIVETTNAGGLAYATAGTLVQAFVTGDTLTAMIDATGMAYLWKTTATSVTSFVGNVQLPTTGTNSFTTGTGRIGIQVPTNSRVDNFSGGTVP
jgi:hypothetical protein